MCQNTFNFHNHRSLSKSNTPLNIWEQRKKKRGENPFFLPALQCCASTRNSCTYPSVLGGGNGTYQAPAGPRSRTRHLQRKWRRGEARGWTFKQKVRETGLIFINKIIPKRKLFILHMFYIDWLKTHCNSIHVFSLSHLPPSGWRQALPMSDCLFQTIFPDVFYV